ncbi:MAG: helix-turn-helix domain-containing protein [bacterium]|nr:helix-turn-helix domain-containing protein [bacterium]
MKTRKSILLVIIMILVSFSSCKNHISPDIFHDFHILYSESKSLSVVKNQKEWTPIKSLNFIDIPRGNDKNFNHAWVRIKVTVDNPDKYYGLFLNTRDLQNITFINSTFHGSKNLKKDYGAGYYKPNLYKLQKGILKKGNNIVYIRISMIKGLRGSIGPIEIIDKEAFVKEDFWNDVLYKYIFIVLIVMNCLLSMIQLIMFIFDKTIKIRLLNSIILMYTTIPVLLFFIPLPVDNSYVMTFYFTYNFLFFLYLMILMQALFGLFLSRFNKIFIALFAPGFFLAWVLNGKPDIQLIIGFIGVVLSFSGLGALLYLLNKIKSKKNLTRVFIILFCVMSIGYLWHPLTIPLKLPVQCPQFLNIYIQFLYIFMAIVFEAIQSKKQKNLIAKLYGDLKEIADKKEPKSEVTITEIAEEKLNVVINFIKQNYTSDISREGLAAAVDMNTSYLSTLFNTYTGKKFNEYIHSLRIKDAAALLENTDKQIIDIAYTVGFDSLTTFNRAFKNETGSTPSECRKNLKDRL